MNKKEVIVPANDLVCLGKDKLQELIRCKDCKYWNGAGKFCDYEMSGLEEDYCSWTEPKVTE